MGSVEVAGRPVLHMDQLTRRREGPARGAWPLWAVVAFWAAVVLACLPITAWFGAGIGAQLIGYGHFSIPSGSMKPALLIGDRVLAAPFSTPEALRPGDIIVHTTPHEPGVYYIRRLVAFPGQTVQLRHGVVYVDDAPAQLEDDGVFREPRMKYRALACHPKYSTQEICGKLKLTEILPSGAAYSVLDADGVNNSQDNTKEFLVPPEHYFVMGDNRDNSRDSRHDPGFVPLRSIKYHGGFVWLPGDWRLDRVFKSLSPKREVLQ